MILEISYRIISAITLGFLCSTGLLVVISGIIPHPHMYHDVCSKPVFGSKFTHGSTLKLCFATILLVL